MLLFLLMLCISIWAFAKLLRWALLSLPLFARSQEESDFIAEGARVEGLIGLYRARKKDGDIAGADQIEAELREQRIEGWYRPVSPRPSDER